MNQFTRLFYENAIRINAKYDDQYALSAEIEMMQEAQVDIYDSLRRSASFIKYPSKYFRLSKYERDEDTSDFDPDAVMDEIMQHANMGHHQEIINCIRRDLAVHAGSRECESAVPPSVMTMIGRFVGRLCSFIGRVKK